MTQNKARSPPKPPPTDHSPSAHPGINSSSRTLRQSWMALPAGTRLKFSVAMLAVATVGLFASDYLEEKLLAQPQNSQKST